MQPERSFLADGDGVKIMLAEWPGEGEPVLCVHGLTANLHCFELLAAGLAPRHRVLAMDLRGRGRSQRPATGYSLEHHCRDIAAVIDGLGIGPVNLAGHSLGAYISLAMAAGHPKYVRRLVLLDGGGELSPAQWEKVGAGISPSVERLGKVSPSIEAYLEQMKANPFFQPWNQTLERYFRYDIEEVPDGVRSSVRPEHIAEERGNLAAVRPSELHPLVKCPVLALRATKGMLGGDEILLPDDALEAMLSAMPRARSVDLDDANHFSIMFQPNPARDAALREFLAEPV